MKLEQALQELKAGKCMVREGWSEDDGYLVLMQGMKYVWKILFHPTPNAGNFTLTVDDMCAEDWVEFDACKFSKSRDELVSDLSDAA